jgi:hypothetical protein
MTAKTKPESRKQKNQAAPCASRDAKRTAEVILEVLAGALAPLEAASALGMSISRYYMIESKAMDGLVNACEPGRKGRTESPDKKIEALERDNKRLERETARYQALVRASQRTVGLAVKRPPEGKDKRGRKRRKPVSRALRFAEKLKEQIEGGVADDEQGKTAGGAETGGESGRLGAGKEETAGDPGDDSGK